MQLKIIERYKMQIKACIIKVKLYFTFTTVIFGRYSPNITPTTVTEKPYY